MTFNIASLPQTLVTLVAALVTSTVFVSAAIGPVSQFI